MTYDDSVDKSNIWRVSGIPQAIVAELYGASNTSPTDVFSFPYCPCLVPRFECVSPTAQLRSHHVVFGHINANF